MNGPAPLLPLLASCLAPLALLWAWHRVPQSISNRISGLTPWLSGVLAPLLVGIAAAALVICVWGSTSEPGVIHDERAMLLQARIFAMGRWRGPTPPTPQFFEQMHVFLEPGVAAKYPPVHSAMLVPGVWINQPGLMPVLLTGVTAALFFVIARRAFGGWVALASCVLLITSRPNLFWRASYFSEVTTSVLWMLMLWAFSAWREARRPSLLATVAACAGLMTLTRPLSGVLLSLPIAVMVARDLWRTRTWAQALVPAALAILMAGVVPLWSERTLDEWTSTPYEEYSRLYMPFDRPGFGIDPTPAVRPLPPDLATIVDSARSIHEWHVVTRLPAIVAERVVGLFRQLGAGWRWGLLVLCLSGLGSRAPLERLMASSAGCLFAGYLCFANSIYWTVYYLEIFPVVFLLAVVQLWRLARQREPIAERKQASADGLLAVSLVLVVPLLVSDVVSTRALREQELEFHHRAERDLAQLRVFPATVFVRYGSEFNPKLTLVNAPVDGTHDALWVVRDLGPRNQELCAAAPNRAAYQYDATTRQLTPGGCGSP